jgi:steroid delta-isomerase-like uncharacterized protein
MALEMRDRCERCGRGLDLGADAFVCSYECTFCPDCTTGMNATCPNCGGELLKRPRRKAPTVTPRDVVRRLHEIWTTGDAERADDVYAKDFVAHFPSSGELPERRGLDGVRRGIQRIKTAFPDWREDVEDMVAEGNRVVTRYVSRGTHRGTFWGIAASGRRVELPEISIYRIVRGKVAEQWCAFDELTRMQQLGATLARPRP